jgi:anti-anti-sigma regulatory factor
MPLPPRRAQLAIDVSRVTSPDCGTVDRLARLQLRARRRGRTIVLVGAQDRLLELIALAGLAAVLPSAVEMRWQAEEREVALRVEEERDAVDLPVSDLEDLD